MVLKSLRTLELEWNGPNLIYVGLRSRGVNRHFAIRECHQSRPARHNGAPITLLATRRGAVSLQVGLLVVYPIVLCLHVFLSATAHSPRKECLRLPIRPCVALPKELPKNRTTLRDYDSLRHHAQ